MAGAASGRSADTGDTPTCSLLSLTASLLPPDLLSSLLQVFRGLGLSSEPPLGPLPVALPHLAVAADAVSVAHAVLPVPQLGKGSVSSASARVSAHALAFPAVPHHLLPLPHLTQTQTRLPDQSSGIPVHPQSGVQKSGRAGAAAAPPSPQPPHLAVGETQTGSAATVVPSAPPNHASVQRPL